MSTLNRTIWLSYGWLLYRGSGPTVFLGPQLYGCETVCYEMFSN